MPPVRGPGAMTTEALIAASAEELAADALDVARGAFGATITYSPKVFVPLTQLCRDRCGYCTFAQAPARLAAPYLSLDEVMEIARAGDAAGCTEVALHPGRAPGAALRRGRALAGRARLRVHGRLRGQRRGDGARGHRAAPARQRRGALRPRAGPPARGQRLPGDDARDPGRRRRPTAWPPTRRPSVASPPSTPPARWPSPSRPACWWASARTAPTGWRRCARSPSRTVATATSKRSSSRTSCPRRAPPWPARQPPSAEEFAWTIAAARLVLPSDVHLQAPPNLVGRPRGAAGLRDRRLRRDLAGHARPRQPRARLAGRRDPRGRVRDARPRCSPRASPCTRSTSSAPSTSSTRPCAPRCSATPTRSAWPAATTGTRAPTPTRRPPRPGARARPTSWTCSRATSRATTSTPTSS